LSQYNRDNPSTPSGAGRKHRAGRLSPQTGAEAGLVPAKKPVEDWEEEDFEDGESEASPRVFERKAGEKSEAFFRKLFSRKRKKRLPSVSDYPAGEAPLWVSDPLHYQKKLSKWKKFQHSVRIVCLMGFLALCVIGITMLGIAAAVVYSFSDTDLDERFASMDLDYSSFIYATNPTTGESYVYQEIQSTSGMRVWVSDSEIPQCVKDAVVATEDKRFYQHIGVDPIRTFKSTMEYAIDRLKGGDGTNVSGGSTLTQQVIKNMTQDAEQTWTRKVKEMLRALYIERRYTKDQILEYYLNTVYFGQSANGISAAADIYFNKSVTDLTPVEAAAIIAVTKSHLL
jgi:hypothetical protein